MWIFRRDLCFLSVGAGRAECTGCGCNHTWSQWEVVESEVCVFFSSSHPLLTLRAEEETSSPSPPLPPSDWYQKLQCSVNSPPNTPETRKRCAIFHSTMKMESHVPAGKHVFELSSTLILASFWHSTWHSWTELSTQVRHFCPHPLEAGWRLILIRKSHTGVNTLSSRINVALTHLCPPSSAL